MKKILFLDIDGVLKVGHTVANELFDPSACRNLSRLIRATGCKIVVSSSWRKYYSNEEIEAFLHGSGVVEAAVVGSTDLMLGVRGHEVDRWVNAYRPDRYVIIDDYDRSEWLASQINNLVITDPEIGLTFNDADKAIEILNK